MFRLPPPIPGKAGGGYPQEWHSAQTTIKRNYVAHMERKRARAPVMQEVILCVRGGKPPRPPARWRCLRVLIACSFRVTRFKYMLQVELQGDQPSADGVRKRDMLFKVFGRATTSLSQVAEQVYKHEAVQKAAAQFSGAVAGTGEKWQNAQTTIGELRAATGAKVGEMQAVISTRAELLGQLTAERRDQYKGWVMEKMVTPAAGAAAAVGFFLARTEGRESSFDACRKQERVEVVDISARNCIKTTLIVQPGDTLNWTFGALLS